MSLLLGATAFAQESPSKQINQIKRNNAYLYAEATMESAEEALTMARELLIQQVQEYVEGKIKFDFSDDIIVKNINAKSETVSMMRGTMYRMFVYVKKSDIEAIDNATVINTNNNTVKEVLKQSLPPTPAPEPPAQPIVEASERVEKVEETVMKETSQEPVTVVKVYKENPDISCDIPQWQQQAINDLLESADIDEVKAKFNRMKTEYKLKRYGTPDKCPSANNAFWVIFGQNGHVETVLGPGSSERVSFKDMSHSSLDNYKGQNALWFNFAK